MSEEAIQQEIEREREVEQRRREAMSEEARKEVLPEFLSPKELRRLELFGEYVNESGQLVKE